MNEKDMKCRGVHSIVNNVRYVKADTFKGDQMKFTLKRMKELAGMSEQAMIMRMLWFAFDHDDFFKDFREQLKTEWSVRKAGN